MGPPNPPSPSTWRYFHAMFIISSVIVRFFRVANIHLSSFKTSDTTDWMAGCFGITLGCFHSSYSDWHQPGDPWRIFAPWRKRRSTRWGDDILPKTRTRRIWWCFFVLFLDIVGKVVLGELEWIQTKHLCCFMEWSPLGWRQECMILNTNYGK